jgi:hypothetical protein
MTGIIDQYRDKFKYPRRGNRLAYAYRHMATTVVPHTQTAANQGNPCR